MPIAEPPDWLIKLIGKGSRTHHAPNAPRNAKYKPVTDDELRELMEGVPNDDQTSWEQWNRVGMALYAATNGSWFGAELFDQWSEKNDKYDSENTELKWSAYDTSPPNNIDVGTLFFLAGSAQFEAEMAALAGLEARGEWKVRSAWPAKASDWPANAGRSDKTVSRSFHERADGRSSSAPVDCPCSRRHRVRPGLPLLLGRSE